MRKALKKSVGRTNKALKKAGRKAGSRSLSMSKPKARTSAAPKRRIKATRKPKAVRKGR